MNNPYRPLTLTTLVCLCTLTLPGCVRLKPVLDSSRHFTLSAVSPKLNPADPPGPGPALGLRLITFPSHLENPRLAQRKGDHEIHYLDSILWAEPLDRGFLRVLGLNLTRSLRSEALFLEEWRRDDVDFEVCVDLVRFEPDDRGLVTLEAEWRIASPGQRGILRTGSSRLQKQGPPLSTDPSGAVAALSAVLGEFSRAVAESLTALAAPGK